MLDSGSGNQENQYYVDLEAFEADISDGPSLGLDLHNSFNSLNHVYDALRKYIMSTNGNIYSAFKAFDLDGDNFISIGELNNLLQ